MAEVSPTISTLTLTMNSPALQWKPISTGWYSKRPTSILPRLDTEDACYQTPPQYCLWGD